MSRSVRMAPSMLQTGSIPVSAATRTSTKKRAVPSTASPAVRREVALSLRDVPIAQSRDLLLTLARGYDGRDRAYLEAWGIGCSGKEADVYAAISTSSPDRDRDPTKWPAAYANLIWRL